MCINAIKHMFLCNNDLHLSIPINQTNHKHAFIGIRNGNKSIGL